MDDRLTQLEMLFTEQKKMLEDMSSEMYRQQQDIVRLTMLVEKLDAKLADLSEASDIGGNERPPHY